MSKTDIIVTQESQDEFGSKRLSRFDEYGHVAAVGFELLREGSCALTIRARVSNDFKRCIVPVEVKNGGIRPLCPIWVHCSLQLHVQVLEHRVVISQAAELIQWTLACEGSEVEGGAPCGRLIENVKESRTFIVNSLHLTTNDSFSSDQQLHDFNHPNILPTFQVC